MSGSDEAAPPPPEGADHAPILTVPDELEHVAHVVPTGNAWVALPDVDAGSGAIPSVTLLHDAAGGLIELRGRDLCAPRVSVNGAEVPTDAWQGELIAGLLPRWRAHVAGCELRLTIACPPDHRGLVVELTATNAGGGDVEVALGFTGHLDVATLHVFSSRPIEGPHRWRFDPWSRALVHEVNIGLPVAALAVRAEDGAAPSLDADDTAGTGLGVRWSHDRAGTLAAGDSRSFAVHLGVGRETDAATLATVDLARHGGSALIERTRRWFAHRCGPTLPGRPALAALRDRNRLFSLTFAAGRTIDGEELVLVTSRSPRYYVSGAHWTRDSLLWAFPSVLAADRDLAADWLRSAFGRYTHNAGTHALTIDGAVLYPGFELDEVAAFLLALDRALEADARTSAEAPGSDAASAPARADLLDEATIREGLARVDAALDGARDAGTGLYATFLTATDDPAPLPFVTSSNALTVAALRARARIRRRLGDEIGARRADQRAGQLWSALREQAVVEGPFGPMLAGASDGQGATVLFDEPPGSLELLAYHGVLDPDDPLFTATVAWIHSDHNPHGPGQVGGDGPHTTPTCPHARHPWLLAVGNALLRGEHRWLDVLPELPLDNGFACETFDATTGAPRTGVGFATCAGWLAHAIDVATSDGHAPTLTGGSDVP